MREIHIPAEDVRRVRRALQLTQREFASRLHVSRRTVIRGEKRGLEQPLGSWSPRAAFYQAWVAAAQEAAARGPRKSDTLAIAKRSPPAGGDTLVGISPKVSPRPARDTKKIHKKSPTRRRSPARRRHVKRSR